MAKEKENEGQRIQVIAHNFYPLESPLPCSQH